MAGTAGAPRKPQSMEVKAPVKKAEAVRRPWPFAQQMVSSNLRALSVLIELGVVLVLRKTEGNLEETNSVFL